ncbi:hypothetical protein DYB28_000968 [Aphanomyces astaci]|uniref:Uncharacterized protein n=1 Tax=Aphanomyces astaci TaxID=112090 RepID=A0A9X8EAC4_APHAT|nr:hypothetical protein DYB28_000968 [Aphanomyces astaci]
MKRALYAIVALLLLPVIAVWSGVSWILGQSGRFAALVALVIVLTLAGLCIFRDSIAIYDLPAAFAVVLLLLTTSYVPKSFLFHVTLVVAFLSYAIARHQYSFASSSTATLEVALTACSCAGVVWTFVCANSLWIPANADALHHTETAVYKSTLKSAPFHMTIVAGLGTVHVPYAGPSKAPPSNVVLIHGFAGGNALWAAVRLSQLRHGAGPLGPRLMRFILTARLSRQPDSNAIKRGVLDMDLMVAYNYHNWAGSRSGEVAMYTHLLPVWAHDCVITTT